MPVDRSAELSLDQRADDLRPEAFVVRTHDEQRQILRDMFGDDWDEEDEAALEAA